MASANSRNQATAATGEMPLTSTGHQVLTEIDEEGSNASGYPNDGRSNWRLLGLGMFFLFYLALGASVFSAIEGPIETAETEELISRKKAFLEKYDVQDDDLEEFMLDVVQANDRGVSIFRNGTSVPSWSFGQSFFFASTVVTTIGYGHQSPLSGEGKVFCILYAIVGIPMTLVLLAAVVERALMPVNALLARMHDRLGNRYQPIYVYLMHFTLVVVLVITFFFLVPAAIFANLERKWNYLDSLYYCFISLTTIGLGDFIPGDMPGQDFRPLYKAATTFYLLIGVTAMMVTLSVFYNIPRCDFKLFFLLRPDQCMNGGATISGSANSVAVGRSSNADPERIRLQTAGTRSGPKYTQHLDDPEDENRRRVVLRARSRPSDSPSPTDEGGPQKPIPGPSGRRK